MQGKILFLDKSPSFYKEYPNLFSKYFKKIPREQINALSKAGYHYYHAVLCLDAIIDDGDFKKIPQMLTLQEESIKLLTSVYGLESEFWNLWDKRKAEYFEAVRIEKFLSKSDNFDFEAYQDLADKKSAFGKVAIDSLFSLEQNKDFYTYQKLLLSHKSFSVGFQLYDDVKDFKEDFEKGQFNYAIEQLKKGVDFDQYKQDITILNKILFIKGIGQSILSKSILQFEQAIAVLNDLGIQSEWLKTVIEMKVTIKNYLDITNGYLATITAKLELKNLQSNTYHFFDFNEIKDNRIKNGLDFIKSDFQQNYTDLKHIMYLGQLDGFENDINIHISDTFQRALLNDCFYTISNYYKLDISDFIKNECQYLIGLRNKDIIGGWSYFPTVHEIAADIDDLGQMIQFFVLSKNQQFVDEYCQNAITIALNERMLNNGGIETWVIPKEGQNKVQKRQEYFNATKWGKGPDVEVVANFTYSLAILDKEQYWDVIKKAISYIVDQQETKGYWESRWYYGNYYGTYVCLRSLREFEKDFKKEIRNALYFLTSSQNEDGGFSIDKNKASDPLSTALATLGLKLFFDKNYEAIKKAVIYLKNLQNEDGSWMAVDFIKPKVHEPYKSKTLTTAYVLKALSI
ncbi:MAG: prenyltransferase [Flavobacteriaceae bacterium]|nr:prenyltransferase [Flavobacteriaceae bacterium]